MAPRRCIAGPIFEDSKFGHDFGFVVPSPLVLTSWVFGGSGLPHNVEDEISGLFQDFSGNFSFFSRLLKIKFQDFSGIFSVFSRLFVCMYVRRSIQRRLAPINIFTYFSFVTPKDSLFQLLPSYGRQQRFSTNFGFKTGSKSEFQKIMKNVLKGLFQAENGRKPENGEAPHF